MSSRAARIFLPPTSCSVLRISQEEGIRKSVIVEFNPRFVRNTKDTNGRSMVEHVLQSWKPALFLFTALIFTPSIRTPDAIHPANDVT